MDHRGGFLAVAAGLILLQQLCFVANAHLVLPVERKFKGPFENLGAIKAHDANRHGRLLTAIDIPLGGNGRPASTGLYYTKIGLGTPPKEFTVQVDTGSDILWVNCAACKQCPAKSPVGVDLTIFDPSASLTSKLLPCNDNFCTSTYGGEVSGCSSKELESCPYSITYGDGTTTAGSFMRDALTFDKVSGDSQLAKENTSVVFGCSKNQTGMMGSTEDDALDGIIGFGQSNSSVLSQLAASGKVKKIFSHCLDSVNGGGIFAIGEVVQPKVNTTSLLKGMAHYNVILKDMEVGGEAIQLPTDFFGTGNGRGTIMDSGTTLAYLPHMVYEQLLSKILGQQPGLKLYLVEEQFTCFHYSGNLDQGFPLVKFHFDGISLSVKPSDYLFLFQADMFCIGWQKSSTQNKDGKELILLGDLVLSNKVVVYDLENMVIGWTDYNCSSNIKVKDETTKSVYTMNARDLTSDSAAFTGTILTFFLLIIAMINI